MNRRISTLAVGLALLACGAVQAQFHHGRDPLPPDPAPQPSDLNADQLIAKHVAARGGEAKLKALKTVKMTGTWQANVGNPSPVILMMAKGRYARRIAPDTDVAMILTVDNATSWEINKRSGINKPQPLPAKDLARFRRFADPQGPLFDAKAKGNKVEVVGKMPWKDTQVYKVKVTYPDGGVIHLYLDAKTFMVVRSLTSLWVDQLGKNIDSETVYKDFRDVDGVKFPFRETSDTPDANFTQTMSWSSIEVNKPLDEAAFKPPQG